MRSCQVKHAFLFAANPKKTLLAPKRALLPT
jgi:hypothetical protein